MQPEAVKIVFGYRYMANIRDCFDPRQTPPPPPPPPPDVCFVFLQVSYICHNFCFLKILENVFFFFCICRSKFRDFWL